MPKQIMTKPKAMEIVERQMSVKCVYDTFHVAWIDGHEVFMLYYHVKHESGLVTSYRFEVFIDGKANYGGIIS